MKSMNAGSALDDVLVVTLRKDFWASPESLVFPNRIYEKRIGKHNQNRPSIYFLAARALLYTLRRKPKVILFGSAHKTVPRFIELKRRGYLQGTRLIATNQISFNDSQAEFVDRIIVFSRSEIALHDPKLTRKYEFIPIPVDGQYHPFQPSKIYPSKRGGYIFSGGGSGRDFGSLIEAVRGLDVRLKIVSFSVKTLGYTGSLPENCEFHEFVPEEKYVELMADSLFVAFPLTEGAWPHGHTTVVQAFVLGKAVVTTKNSSIDDYVINNSEGILVSPGDVIGYREATKRLQNDPEFLDACGQRAQLTASKLTYRASAQRFANLCSDVLAS